MPYIPGSTFKREMLGSPIEVRGYVGEDNELAILACGVLAAFMDTPEKVTFYFEGVKDEVYYDPTRVSVVVEVGFE